MPLPRSPLAGAERRRGSPQAAATSPKPAAQSPSRNEHARASAGALSWGNSQRGDFHQSWKRLGRHDRAMDGMGIGRSRPKAALAPSYVERSLRRRRSPALERSDMAKESVMTSGRRFLRSGGDSLALAHEDPERFQERMKALALNVARQQSEVNAPGWLYAVLQAQPRLSVSGGRRMHCGVTRGLQNYGFARRFSAQRTWYPAQPRAGARPNRVGAAECRPSMRQAEEKRERVGVLGAHQAPLKPGKPLRAPLYPAP
jgi:hypothetical protein